MNEDYQHKFDSNISEGVHLHGVQVWRPSVAEPMWVGFGLRKAKCECGRVFKDRETYRNHFIYEAVWEDESGYIPQLIESARKFNGYELQSVKALLIALRSELPEVNTGDWFLDVPNKIYGDVNGMVESQIKNIRRGRENGLRK